MIEIISNGKTYSMMDTPTETPNMACYQIFTDNMLYGTLIHYKAYKRFSLQYHKGRWEMQANNLAAVIEELSHRLP